MKDKIREIIEMQKALDLSIINSNNVDFDSILDSKRVELALFDELGELNHELKSDWCWWKKSQKPKNRDRVLEELIDCLHFATIISYRSMDDKELNSCIAWYCNNDGTLTLGYSEKLLFAYYNAILNCKQCMFMVLMLGRNLGYSFDEMYQAYINKNKVNFDRQKQGY